MFEYIRGKLEEKRQDVVVIENGAFGYLVHVSLTTMAALPALHEEIKLFLVPAFREDDVSLYGFMTDEERGLFTTLIGISGIGPKAAMALLSQFAGDVLIHHVLNGDAKAIAKAPGIGKKTAERIILELKDKYKDVAPSDAAGVVGGATARMQAQDDLYHEAVTGLLGLGYSYAQASELVEHVLQPDMTIEDILKAALVRAGSSAS